VRQAVEDWLREGLDGTSERTRALYQGLLEPVMAMIGARPLRDLTATPGDPSTCSLKPPPAKPAGSLPHPSQDPATLSTISAADIPGHLHPHDSAADDQCPGQ